MRRTRRGRGAAGRQHGAGGRIDARCLGPRTGAKPGPHDGGAPRGRAGQQHDAGGRLHRANRATGGRERGPLVCPVAGLRGQRHGGRRGVHQRGRRAGAALRQHARPDTRPGSGAGRRQRTESTGHAAQGQHRLRPEAMVHRRRRHPGRGHRRVLQAIRAAAQGGDRLGGGAHAASGGGSAGPTDRRRGRTGHRLRTDRPPDLGPSASAPAGRHARPFGGARALDGAVRCVRDIGVDGSRARGSRRAGSGHGRRRRDRCGDRGVKPPGA
ncbi:hypothetical protein D3C73_1038860 [compost metagenome]